MKVRKGKIRWHTYMHVLKDPQILCCYTFYNNTKTHRHLLTRWYIKRNCINTFTNKHMRTCTVTWNGQIKEENTTYSVIHHIPSCIPQGRYKVIIWQSCDYEGHRIWFTTFSYSPHHSETPHALNGSICINYVSPLIHTQI